MSLGSSPPPPRSVALQAGRHRRRRPDLLRPVPAEDPALPRSHGEHEAKIESRDRFNKPNQA